MLKFCFQNETSVKRRSKVLVASPVAPAFADEEIDFGAGLAGRAFL